jgi:hypothetical protein
MLVRHQHYKRIVQQERRITLRRARWQGERARYDHGHVRDCGRQATLRTAHLERGMRKRT